MPNFISTEKRSVAGIVFEENRIFIARRLPGGDMGSKWEFPGGKVEDGESDEQALVREYMEEFGVSITTGSKLAEAQFEHNGKNYTLNAYAVYFGSLNFTLTEHSEWRWASLEEIEKSDFVDSDLKLVPALKKYFL
jgi:8-oxo-dGTP diphosphatase